MSLDGEKDIFAHSFYSQDTISTQNAQYRNMKAFQKSQALAKHKRESICPEVLHLAVGDEVEWIDHEHQRDDRPVQSTGIVSGFCWAQVDWRPIDLVPLVRDQETGEEVPAHFETFRRYDNPNIEWRTEKLEISKRRMIPLRLIGQAGLVKEDGSGFK
ncbi:hypothetical protein [Phaffia rhodozyma]|uniref:Uncharacterized protein n=1 Tax=Phaffia rhodozyma TaxID=264483 RepID=A0A0F7SKV0_PHARH|nr:hypothetical protein [Phaffia rhodozyma]